MKQKSENTDPARKRAYHPWAVGITVYIVFFIVATIALVIFISSQHYDLVTENYYEKDQAYQAEIDTRLRTELLSDKPTLGLDREALVFNIIFPGRARYDDIQGEITFYRISDASRDQRHPLLLDARGRQFVSVSAMQRGQWIAGLRWSEDGEEYYIEQRIYL